MESTESQHHPVSYTHQLKVSTKKILILNTGCHGAQSATLGESQLEFSGGPGKRTAILLVSRETVSHLNVDPSSSRGVRFGTPLDDDDAARRKCRSGGRVLPCGKNQSSMRHVPSAPAGATAHKWAFMHAFLSRQPAGTKVKRC